MEKHDWITAFKGAIFGLCLGLILITWFYIYSQGTIPKITTIVTSIIFLWTVFTGYKAITTKNDIHR